MHGATIRFINECVPGVTCQSVTLLTMRASRNPLFVCSSVFCICHVLCKSDKTIRSCSNHCDSFPDWAKETDIPAVM